MLDFSVFGFQAGGSNYHVTFDIKGQPGGVQKEGNQVFNLFEVDKDNRVPTFARL